MPVNAACREILAGAGAQFDPECAALLVSMISEMGEDGLEERFVRFAS
jgi:hypothetical protein